MCRLVRPNHAPTETNMASFPGRSGRRRRVLNEEVLSASSSHVALRAAPREGQLAAGAPRYSDAAAVDNQPLVTDFVPQRRRTIAVFLFGGVAATALVLALHHFATPIVAALGATDAAALDLAAPGSLATWMSAVVLLAACAGCLLVCSIRRHRIDDYRGHYRVWRWAAAVFFVASVDSVAGLHVLLAEALSHHAGWTALRDGAVWWLMLAGIPVAWIVVRTFFDLRECRLAALWMLAAVTAYATATASFLGWLSPAQPNWEPMITGGAELLGHWLLLTAVVSYARYVVLDAQGLIPARCRPPAARQAVSGRASASPLKTTAPPAVPAVPASGGSRDKSPMPVVPVKLATDSNQWVDGSRRQRDRYEDDDTDADDRRRSGRKLSKAERKRLRRLKARNRAA